MYGMVVHMLDYCPCLPSYLLEFFRPQHVWDKILTSHKFTLLVTKDRNLVSNWPKVSFPTITKDVNFGREEFKSIAFPHPSALRFEHRNMKAVVWSWYYLQSIQEELSSPWRLGKKALIQRSPKAIQLNIISLAMEDLKAVNTEHWDEVENCIHQKCSMGISHKKVTD